VRVALDADTQRHLDALTQKVTEHTSPKAEAERLWNQKASRPFDVVRSTLERMAAGRARCMYCEDDRGTDIEHFYPKATYPLRAFSWRNYLLACGHCNSNLKREQFPLDAAGQPALVDPTVDDPADSPRLPPDHWRISVDRKQRGAEHRGVCAQRPHAAAQAPAGPTRKTLVKLIALLQRVRPRAPWRARRRRPRC
jgi:hypothetical protein